MNKILRKNLANVIVLLRILLLFIAICLLNAESLTLQISGTALLGVSMALDCVDGYIAQKLSICSKVGALLDTLGDRITENLPLVFFAYKHIIPVYVPLIFITRSFLADFIRLLNFQHGLSTFAVNTSFWGKVFVASRTSRVLYLCAKIFLIFTACLGLMAPQLSGTLALDETVLVETVTWWAAATVIFCLLRFVFLVYDSRTIIKQEFFR